MKKIIKSNEVDEILESAQTKKWNHQKAEDVLAYAETICKIAYKKGFAQGQEDAKSQGLEDSISLVSDSIDYIQHLENDIVDVVLNNIRKIIANYEPDELLFRSVQQSLSDLCNAREITLRISPSISHETLVRLRDIESLSGKVNVVADHRIEKDDCIIESEMGVVHVNVDQKIAQLENIFRTDLDLEHKSSDGSLF
ncbi:MAG: FliH/SctL family protein [Gammaproteobacteria bacterium]